MDGMEASINKKRLVWAFDYWVVTSYMSYSREEDSYMNMRLLGSVAE